MKIKGDFITNSSSSNFVIAYKALPCIDQQTMEKYPFICKCYSSVVQLLHTDRRWDDRETCAVAQLEDIDSAFIRFFCWDDGDTIKEVLDQSDWMKELYDRCKKHIGEGYQILLKNVDYRDEALSELIEALAVGNSDFILLEKDNE